MNSVHKTREVLSLYLITCSISKLLDLD